MKQMSVYRFLNAIHIQILDYGSTRLAKLSSLNRLVLEGSDLRRLGCSVLQSFQRGLSCTSRQRTTFSRLLRPELLEHSILKFLL